MNSGSQTQILDKNACILLCANALRKGMNLLLSPGQNGIFSFDIATNQEIKTSWNWLCPQQRNRAIHTVLIKWRCSWCNGYHCRKWTQRPEFKSWTNLFAFHIMLVPLVKVCIQLSFFQIWVNSMADCAL